MFGWLRRRRQSKRERIDPFTLTDPWRSFVMDAQQAETRFARIIGTVDDGPIADRLRTIDERLRDGVASCWRIAQSGHNLNKAIRQLGATESESVARMRSRKDEIAAKLTLLTSNLDEAVARAAELATDRYSAVDSVAIEVDNVVDELEALRLALAEVSPG